MALILVLAPSVPALGQLDMLEGHDSQSTARFSLYSPDPSGNQNWVREYDGRTFDFGSLETFGFFGYNGPLSYGVYGRDFFIGDGDFGFRLARENLFGVRFATSTMTHRLGPLSAVNPWLVGTVAEGGDDFLDLNPGTRFSIERWVYDFRAGATPGADKRQRVTFNWWQELEAGRRQFIFRADEAVPGVIARREMGGAGIPVNRDTGQVSLGTDFQLGSSTVLNYRFVGTKFVDRAGHPAPGSWDDFGPLNALTRTRSGTTGHIIKARSKIGSRLNFTGVHTRKSRENRASNVDPDANVDRRKVSIDSTNVAVIFRATDSLSLTGRYRRFEWDSDVAAVLDGGSRENPGLSREVKSARLSASYTGIPRTFVSFGFERRDTDRRTDPPLSVEEALEQPFVRESTRSNIYRARLRFHPNPRLSISGNFEAWDTTHPGYSSIPTDRTRAGLDATYLITDNFALYGTFNKLDESNDNIRVDLVPTWTTIPPGATDEEKAAYTQARKDAAGQGYNNQNTTSVVGAWLAVNPKLVLDANYSKISIDAGALWVIGDSVSRSSSVPHWTDAAAYEADNDQWSVGATYTFTPRLRVYGRYFNSNSTGIHLINPANSPGGVGPVWHPVDIDQDRCALGFGYKVSPKDSLQVDFSTSDWQDKIDTANDGRFNLWRLSWLRAF